MAQATGSVEPKDEVSYLSFRLESSEERAESGPAGVQRGQLYPVRTSHLHTPSSSLQIVRGWDANQKVVISTDLTAT